MAGFKLERNASGPITIAALERSKLCGAPHDAKTTIGSAVVFPVGQCDACHQE